LNFNARRHLNTNASIIMIKARAAGRTPEYGNTLKKKYAPPPLLF
jgi:hypothetical protein